VVKEFRRKAALQGADVFAKDCNMTSSSREHCSRLQLSRCHAVIAESIIHFAANTAAEIPNTLQWARQYPKLPLPVGISDTSYDMWSYMSQPPNGISIGSAVFLRSISA